VAIEGGTLNLALLSLSGALFRYAFPFAALLISVGSIATSICFGFLTWFYSKLLAVSVDTAKNLEDEIFPRTWNSNLAENKIGKKLSHNLDDFGRILRRRLAGENTWIVVLLEFVVLFLMGLAMFIYLLFLLLSPPVDC